MIPKQKVAKIVFNGLKNTIMSNDRKGKKENNDDQRTQHANTIIRNHVIWSMGAGMIPILVADVFAVTALQMDMIKQLSRVYGHDFSETQGKAIVTSLTGSTLARMGARSVVKLIPGIGSLLGGATVSVFAGASTYAIGEVFKEHFNAGGTFLDFDPERLKNLYKEKFEKGKKEAPKMKKEAKNGDIYVDEEDLPVEEEVVEPKADSNVDVVEKLKALATLRDSGVLTDEEFETMKKKLIDNF